MTAQSFVDTIRGFFDRGKAVSLDEHLEGEEGLWRIWRNSSKDDSDWAIYLKSDLDLDTDGPRSRGIKYAVTHQDDGSRRDHVSDPPSPLSKATPRSPCFIDRQVAATIRPCFPQDR